MDDYDPGMPTICPECKGLVDFSDMRVPDIPYFEEFLCPTCANDLEEYEKNEDRKDY